MTDTHGENVEPISELILFVDDNFTEREMKGVVRKLKRKLDKVHVTDTSEAAGQEDIPVKKTRRSSDKISCGTKKSAKVTKVKQEDSICDSVVLKSENRSSKKLTSRLSRILGKSNKNKRTGSNSVECYDSESCASVDSGIQCEDLCNVNTVLPREERDRSQIVAMDCEFVGVGPKGVNALGRCSIIDYNGNILCDIYAKPEDTITDYRTRWSGIRQRDMLHAVPFNTVRNTVKRILQGKIVIGHAIHNDLGILRIKHPKSSIRDTAKCEFVKKLAGLTGSQGNGLKRLAWTLLGREIQIKEHCSVEDSRAALDLYKLVENQWESFLEKNKWTVEDACERKHDDSVCDDFLNDEFWPDELEC